MAWDAPAGVAPVDRKSPSAPTYADIPKVLDWLRASYGGHTVIGLAITDRQSGIYYRVDAESAYPGGYVPAGPRGTYTLRVLADPLALPAYPLKVTGRSEQGVAIVWDENDQRVQRTTTTINGVVYPTITITTED